MTRKREPRFSPGDSVAGTYEIRGLVRQSAAGEVYDATDRALDRRVALHAAPGSPEVRDEARALAAVRHAGLATVYALASHGACDVLVTEWIVGQSLATRLAARRQRAERMALEEALDLLTAIAEALAALHAGGVAHRDVSPTNVVVAARDRVVLLDVVLGAGARAPAVDGATHVCAPGYAAPELVSDRVAPSGPRSVDIYALGAIAFELLAGAPAFEGRSPEETLSLHLMQTPDIGKHRTGIPRRLQLLVNEMLARTPAERPPSVDAIVRVLGQIRGRPSMPSSALKAARKAPAVEDRAALDPPSPAAASDDALHVVVVDRDPRAQVAMARGVRRAIPSAMVSVVASEGEALRQVRARPPRFMVLELEAPGMNGVELAMYVRGLRLPRAPGFVIACERASPEDELLFAQLGLHGVTKGAALEEQVVAIVRSLNDEPAMNGGDR